MPTTKTGPDHTDEDGPGEHGSVCPVTTRAKQAGRRTGQGEPCERRPRLHHSVVKPAAVMLEETVGKHAGGQRRGSEIELPGSIARRCRARRPAPGAGAPANEHQRDADENSHDLVRAPSASSALARRGRDRRSEGKRGLHSRGCATGFGRDAPSIVAMAAARGSGAPQPIASRHSGRTFAAPDGDRALPGARAGRAGGRRTFRPQRSISIVPLGSGGSTWRARPSCWGTPCIRC